MVVARDEDDDHVIRLDNVIIRESKLIYLPDVLRELELGIGPLGELLLHFADRLPCEHGELRRFEYTFGLDVVTVLETPVVLAALGAHDVRGSDEE